MEHKLGAHLTSPESEIETTADEISAKVLHASQNRGKEIEVHVREAFPTKWTKNEFIIKCIVYQFNCYPMSHVVSDVRN